MQPLQNIRFIYVTAPSAMVADNLARKLLEQKLIACANLLPGMTSLYFWEGQIEKSAETVLILKTTKEAVNYCIDSIKKAHPSTIPCIASFKIEQANSDFVAWLNQQVPSHESLDL